MPPLNPQAEFQRIAFKVRDLIIDEAYARAAPISMLAHYTSVDNLRSILASQEFWFSHVRDMEDTSEVIEGADIVKDALASRGPTAIRSFNFSELDAVGRFGTLTDQLVQETYAISLCEHGSDAETDRLVMWRAYGHNGRGICLVLRKQTLLGQKAKGLFPVHWAPIEYEAPAQTGDRVARRLELIDEAVAAAPKALLPLLKPAMGAFIVGCVVSIVFGHKNPAFRDEKEVRFVRSPLLNTLPLPRGVEYRNVGTLNRPRKIFALALREYPEFPINASMSAMLDHVIVGPSHEQDAMFSEVRSVLDNAALGHVPIHRSTIPYKSNR